MVNLKNLLVELEFKTPEDFAAYKKKHKMRPGTVVKVAGKDKVVGDDKPKAPKTPTFVNDDGDVVANDFDSALDLAANLGMSDEELDYIEKEKDMESLGDYLDGQGYSQKQEDEPKDEPKGKKMQITMDFQSSNKKDLERFADKYGLKLGSVDNNPNYGLEAEFEGSEEDLKKFMTSDDYGLDPKDFDQYAKEYGDELDVDPKIDKQMATAAEKANMKMDRDEINGILKKKNEPFAEEVEEILYDKFKDMGSTGKKLKQKLDTIASYEMGIYDMSEKEYNQERKEVKKELDNYYKKQGLDENLKELSKIKTRYNR